jgi:hypothetical protein
MALLFYTYDTSSRNQENKCKTRCVSLFSLFFLQDILKRNTYVYKGRIHLDTSEVVDVPDGKGKDQFSAYNTMW